MYMEKNELVRRYKEAGGSSKSEKNRQIKILAELNGCTVDDIRKALTEAGIDLPGKPGPRKGEQSTKVAKPAKKVQADAEDKTKKQISSANVPPKTVESELAAAITDKIEGLIEVQNQARREIERMEEVFEKVTEAIKLLRDTFPLSNSSTNLTEK